MWKEIANAISEKKGITFEILKANPIAGGCINESYYITDNNQCYFVKLNHNDSIETPPEDYEPDKVGQVDMGKLQAAREAEIKQSAPSKSF